MVKARLNKAEQRYLTAVRAYWAEAGPVGYRGDAWGLLIDDPWMFQHLEKECARLDGLAEGLGISKDQQREIEESVFQHPVARSDQ